MMRAPCLALLLLVSACAVGPDYRRPPTPKPANFQPAAPAAPDQAQVFVRGLDIPGQWWSLFHSAPLESLIKRALAANPSLAAAQAALRQARENVYAQEGAYLPNITGSFESSRNKTATRALSVASSSGSPYYTLHTAQLSVSYAPDVFGLNQRSVEGLVAQTAQQRYALEASFLTLTANAVTAAINEASLRAQIAATNRLIAGQTELLTILQKQYQYGQVAQVDVLAQQAALAQAQATLPPLQKQLDQQRDALATLAGTTPDQAIPETFTLAGLTLPHAMPVSIPASLVNQRPDILQAEENLHAASAAIGVAIANRIPVINLTAEGGSAANHFSQLFSSGTGFWTLAASVSQPIFDGGTLLHKERAARAALDQAAAQYRSTTLAAFQNVADTLAALESDGRAVDAAATAAEASHATLRLVQLQVHVGQVPYLNILNAEQTALQADLSLIQAQANRLADSAALFQALGGGWWNRQDVQLRDIRGNDWLAIIGLH